jgi:hypothetical protein
MPAKELIRFDFLLSFDDAPSLSTEYVYAECKAEAWQMIWEVLKGFYTHKRQLRTIHMVH